MHTISLPIAKRLRELGVPQKSLFYWGYHNDPMSGSEMGVALIYSPNESQKPTENHYDGEYSAFLSSELSEMLPVGYRTNRYEFPERGYIVWDHPKVKEVPEACAATEADARGLMLIHLLEQGIITLPKNT